MKLIIEWNTPEEFLDQAAQVFYLAADGHLDDLNKRLKALHGDKPLGAEVELKPAAKEPEPVEEPKPKATAKAPAKASAKPKPKPEPAPEPEPEPEEESVPWDEVTSVASMDELRQAFVAKNTPKNRPTLKAILAELGVTKVTELPEDRWAEALEKLEAI